ncbi:MAG: hypothetical protein M3X11_05085, partial [Acidobacteriota bacterium]|nr:hypothetical protein [Acidobacteriota bacterium]
WTFTFKDKGRQVGQLILALPDKATFFKADTNRPPHRRAPVAVYKEVRFEGAVRGTGIFAKGIAPKTKFRLVLQGEGSHCLATEEFYRWNLNVHGPSASYSFYGFFASPTR